MDDNYSARDVAIELASALDNRVGASAFGGEQVTWMRDERDVLRVYDSPFGVHVEVRSHGVWVEAARIKPSVTEVTAATAICRAILTAQLDALAAGVNR